MFAVQKLEVNKIQKLEVSKRFGAGRHTAGADEVQVLQSGVRRDDEGGGHGRRGGVRGREAAVTGCSGGVVCGERGGKRGGLISGAAEAGVAPAGEEAREDPAGPRRPNLRTHRASSRTPASERQQQRGDDDNRKRR
ncbi:hypothetical protein B296_00040137 [Ensete ventricosum]|uniref:Uncharacterized protein n=1 Tax=Ensete ventricosum TaxID=4639 RepID=A0A426XL32_ENSVE|nr:hypothetical protein B296_00040137 [Ensete ventricosum]